MIPTLQEIKNQFTRSLGCLYPAAEAQSMVRILLEETLSMPALALLTQPERVPKPSEWKLLQSRLQLLLKGMPIQYVLGSTTFYELLFEVNEHTLIPRQETEELVHRIIEEVTTNTVFSHAKRPLRLLDIGTGSGCIAICLAKHLPEVQVTAIDISTDALAMAQKNAAVNGVTVQFGMVDILHWKTSFAEALIPNDALKFDLIVANPPYVPIRESAAMHQNVLAYEPHMALFAPDQDPLIFYREICAFATQHLQPHGQVWFELHDTLTLEYHDLFNQQPSFRTQIWEDLNGKSRIAQLSRF